MNDNMTNGLVQQWVPVTDAHGRARLEARWVAFGELTMASFEPRTVQAAHAA